MLALWIAAAIVVAVFLLVIVRSVRIVPQARAAVVERLGRYVRTQGPGLTLLLPFVDRMRPLIDLREQVVSFPPQPVITSDNLTVAIDSVIYFQVTDPRAATYEIQNYIQAVEQLTITTLRNVVGSLNLEQALTSRDCDQHPAARRARRGDRAVGHPGGAGRDQGDRPAAVHPGRDGGADARRPQQAGGDPDGRGSARVGDQDRRGPEGRADPRRRGPEAGRDPRRGGRAAVAHPAGRGRPGGALPDRPGPGEGDRDDVRRDPRRPGPTRRCWPTSTCRRCRRSRRATRTRCGSCRASSARRSKDSPSSPARKGDGRRPPRGSTRPPPDARPPSTGARHRDWFDSSLPPASQQPEALNLRASDHHPDSQTAHQGLPETPQP